VERLEAIVSRAIEGWSARLFGAKLQPVQVAKRLIRTMEADTVSEFQIDDEKGCLIFSWNGFKLKIPLASK